MSNTYFFKAKQLNNYKYICILSIQKSKIEEVDDIGFSGHFVIK